VVAISLITISYLGIHHKRNGAGFTAIGHYENDRGKEGPSPAKTHKSGEPFSVRPDVLKSLKLEVAPVSYHELAHYIEVTGRIVANPATHAHIRPRIKGKVAEVKVKLWDKKGGDLTPLRQH